MRWLKKLKDKFLEWLDSFGNKDLEPPLEEFIPPEELPWLDQALADLKLDWKEISGSEHNPKIVQAFKLCGYGPLPDETAWCGVYVGSRLLLAGRQIPLKCAWARHFTTRQKEYGLKLDEPKYGCIVNVERGSAGGTSHVGFLVGWDDNYVRILGGNQRDNVSNSLVVPREKVLSYTWPIKAL